MPHAVLESLHVNDGVLEPSEVSRLQPTDPSLPIKKLRESFKENGYLYLKGLLPREDVLKAREEYFKFLAPSGVLEEGTEPIAGIFNSKRHISEFPGIGVGRVDDNVTLEQKTTDFLTLAIDAHGQKWYADDFCKHPLMLDFMTRFTGWSSNIRPLERTLLRNNIPNTKAIGVHYDQIFLRYGEPTSITVWVPMGDIAEDGGGLIYLEDGQSLGKKFEDEFTAKAKVSGLSDEDAKSAFNKNMLESGVLTEGPAEFCRIHKSRWLVSGFEAGDVVLHSPYMVWKFLTHRGGLVPANISQIHASTVNRDKKNVIRLATDLRFVDSSRQWDQRWSQQFKPGDGV